MSIDPTDPIVHDEAIAEAHSEISETHLPRYLGEWDCKFNTRKISDGERAALALEGADDKCLTYRQPREAAHA